jgi:undecaprenyl-diphosphatase
MRGERTRHLSTVFLAVAALGLAVFLALAVYVTSRQGNLPVDVRIENFVLTHRAGWLITTMKATTWLGSNVVLIPVVVATSAWFLLKWGDTRSAPELVAALAGAIILYTIAKAVVHRARPPAIYRVGYNFSGGSFPSGHSTTAIAVWGMLAFLFALRASPRTRKALSVGAAVLIVAIGASRIYLGAHWPMDVIGGYALGGAWLSFLVALDSLGGKSRKVSETEVGSSGARLSFT